MNNEPSAKGMIVDINSMRTRAIKLLDRDPSYSSLLKSLTKTDYYYDDDAVFPTLKELAEDAGIAYGSARKQLQKIYDDLCSFEPALNIPFEFKNLEILISLEGYNGSKMFTAKSLPVIPRQGESITVPYFQEIAGTTLFYVEKIYHSFCDDNQQIWISLKSGSYSPYWELRKDQGMFLREISLDDTHTKTDRELEEIMGIRRGHAW